MVCARKNGVDLGMVQDDETMIRLLREMETTNNDYFRLHTHRLTNVGIQALGEWLQKQGTIRWLCLSGCFGTVSSMPLLFSILGQEENSLLCLKRLTLSIEIDQPYDESEALERFFRNTKLEKLELHCFGTHRKKKSNDCFLSHVWKGLESRRDDGLMFLEVHVCRGIGLGGVDASVLAVPNRKVARRVLFRIHHEVSDKPSWMAWLGVARALETNELHVSNLSPCNLVSLQRWVLLLQQSSLDTLELYGVRNMCLSQLLLPIMSSSSSLEHVFVGMQRGVYSVLDEENAHALRCFLLQQGDNLRRFGLAMTKCHAGATWILTDVLRHCRLESLEWRMWVPYAVLQEGLSHNHTLLWLDGMDQDGIQRLLSRNTLAKLYTTMIQRDNDTPEGIWPTVLCLLSQRNMHDILYQICREHILLRQQS